MTGIGDRNHPEEVIRLAGSPDPKRIGIHDASHGGYAPLPGLAFTPDLHACGVSYVGGSNIFTVLESMPPYRQVGRKMIDDCRGS